jgi:outer membrane receptor for ferrienterochelin and colicins
MNRLAFLLLAVALILLPVLAHSQTAVQGKVTDKEGEPLVQAHVKINPSERYTLTDTNGEFRFDDIEADEIAITVSYLGFQTFEKKLRLPSKEVITLPAFRLKAVRYIAPTYVVTATRSRRDIEDVPEPVTVISEDEIKNTGSTRLSEILAEQTGLTLTSEHGTGIQVQGFDSEYTKIMIDGQPLIGRTAGTLDLTRISVGNVKQVEMIKGPSSALWGSDALAGVINIITEKNTQPFAADVNSGYSSNQTVDLGTNLSFQSDKLHNSLFLNRNSSEGYRLNPESISKTVPEYQNYTAYYKAQWEASDALDVHVKARLYQENQQSTDYLGSVSQPVLLDGEDRQHEYSLTGALNWDTGKGVKMEVSNYFSRFITDTEYRYRQGDSLYEYSDFDQLLNKSSAQVLSVWNNHHFTTVGGGYQYEQLIAERYSDKPHFNSYFGYIQHEWMPDSKWDISLGLRYDGHNAYNAQLSPKLSTRFKAKKWIHFRVSAGSGFKAPDFRQLYLDFTNPTVGYTVFGSNNVQDKILDLQSRGQLQTVLIPLNQLNGEMDAERSVAINAGVDLFFWQNVSLRLNAFRNNVRDMIETAPIATKKNGQSVFTYFNLERVYTQGVEAQLRWEPLEAFRVSAGYQYLDARRRFSEIRTIVNDAGHLEKKKFSSYEPMFNRSAHTANVKLYYRWAVPDVGFNVRGNWYGKYGRLDQNGNGYVDGNEYNPSYMIWNTAASKTFNERYELRMGIDNLLNFTRPTDFSYYSGRSYFIQLSIHFN